VTAATTEFHWVDGERTIHFGRGKLEQAPELLGRGFALLTTARAAAAAPAVTAAAVAVHEVPPGRVDEVAAELRPRIGSPPDGLLVALGGGRVIDTAKALAAADPPRRVAAIPTTLSGAEMTAVHRQVAGLSYATTPRVRPALVINDPALSASQPLPQLAASACNALGHAFEGPLTPLRHPVATYCGRRAAHLIGSAFAAPSTLEDAERGGGLPAAALRDGLALGALLAGYVIGSTHYGLHHVLAQTLVRLAGVGHGPANAIMLPHTLGALNRRFPHEIAELAAELGEPPAALAERVATVAGATRLRDVVANGDPRIIDRCAEEAATRPDLAFTAPPADADEILAIYRAAW
jgi:alcohol dehydrogenase class IV